MNKIILDGDALEKFGGLKDGGEVCDSTGRTIGFFTPVGCSDESRPDSPRSTEELLRRADEGGGRTLPEIFADLEKRS